MKMPWKSSCIFTNYSLFLAATDDFSPKAGIQVDNQINYRCQFYKVRIPKP